MIAGMVAGEGKPPTYNEVSDGWILESGEYGTNDNGNDEKDIKKCYGFPSGCTYGDATGPSPGRLAEPPPPDIEAK